MVRHKRIRNITINFDTDELLEKLAKEENRTVSNMIDTAIREYAKKKEGN